MRGEIQNRERARQLRDFSGLRFGNITPTDIDGFMDFGDKLFVSFEIKCKGAPFPDGQRLALERHCNAAAESKRRKAILLLLEHDTEPDEDIDVASCVVCKYYYDCEWGEPSESLTCREAIEKLRKWAGIPL